MSTAHQRVLVSRYQYTPCPKCDWPIPFAKSAEPGDVLTIACINPQCLHTARVSLAYPSPTPLP